jgi:DNA invertase Pin-like site-specific DNA recombinase
MHEQEAATETNLRRYANSWESNVSKEGEIFCCQRQTWRKTEKGEAMKTAIYARVSTTGKGQETLNQLAQLREFAEKQGWTIFNEYVDHESGGKSDRVEFQRMFEDASKRKFDVLLFWSLDRLSREGVLPTLKHLERLTGYGIGWRSYTEQFFDSCGPFRDAVIAIMATLAKQERVKLSERTKAGLAIVRAKGRTLGRPIKVNAHASDVTRLRAQGQSLRAIGRSLGISERSVRRLVARTA